MVEVMINYLAVVVAALASMVVGSLWYSPAVFGKLWMKLSGKTEKEMEAAKKKGMGKLYALAFLSSLLMAYVLAHFVDYMGAITFTAGMQTGFWLWLGFIATVSFGMVLWDGKDIRLYLLLNGHELLSLLLMGGILAVWV